MIHSLLSREIKHSINSEYNILWIPSPDPYFEKFFASLGYRLLSKHHLFLGQYVPELAITNNKTSQIDVIIEICLHYQINLCIIDHEIKSEIIDSNKIINKYNKIPNICNIALNQAIADSWGVQYDAVLDYHNSNDIIKWKHIIHNLTHKTFYYE
jgi:hypothetical protein